MKRSALLFALALAGSVAQAGEFYMVTDSSSTSGRRVMLFDVQTGALVDPLYIDLSLLSATTPKHAMQVENEIWVSDQVADRVDIFDLLGNYKTTISGGLDNIRGMGYANGTVYVTNDGNQNGATPDSIVMYDTNRNLLGLFLTAPATSPFAVYEHNGELLISDSSEHTIRRYSYAGASLGVWHQGAIRFPQQITKRRSNNNLLVAGFSPPAGLYEYDPNGNQVNYTLAGLGLRGAQELGDGGILYSVSTGVFKQPAGGGAPFLIHTSNAQYIDSLILPVLSGRIILQDYDGDVTSVPIRMEIREPGSLVPVDGRTINVDASGDYSFVANIVPGTYDVTAKASHWLRQRRGSVVIGPDTTIVSFSLLNGDVDGDNEVSIGDYAVLSAAFGSGPGDPNWDPEADLNGDDSVDIGDYAILSGNFGEAGDD